MMVIFNDGILRELDAIVGFKSDDVGEKITFRQGEILDDEIECIIGVFDAGYRNMANLDRDVSVSDCSHTKCKSSNFHQYRIANPS